MADFPSVTLPDKPAFKASEVCELAQIQPYVLRSWESEFPDLGLSKTPGGPRIYRRADVERVLRIRDLVFIEGLTMSGVRRRFDAEQPAAQDDLLTFVAEVQAAQAKAAGAKAAEARAAEARAAETGAGAIPASSPPRGSMFPSTESAPLASSAKTAASAAVPDDARAKLMKLKQEMRSLLDMLGGEAVTAPTPTATRRARRT